MTPHDPERNPQETPWRVLMVEDDPFFQQVVEETLKSLKTPAIVTKAQCLRDALRAIAESAKPFTFALVDLGLPDGNGIQAIRALQEKFPQSPVVVLSVDSQEKHVLDAVRAGASGYVLKGDRNLSLRQAIDHAVNGITPLSPMLAGYFLKLTGRERRQHQEDDVHLTPRERDLLVRFSQGMSYQQAADDMGIRVTTVQTHIRSLYRKLGVHSGLKALSKAKQAGLL